MALIQKNQVDLIEVVLNGCVQVRQVVSVIDDQTNQIIASSFNRWVMSPGDDVSAQDDRVKAVCNAVWTADVVAEFQKQQAEAAKQLQKV